MKFFSSDKWTNFLICLGVALISGLFGCLIDITHSNTRMFLFFGIPAVAVIFGTGFVVRAEIFFYENYVLSVDHDGMVKLKDVADIVLAKTPEEILNFAKNNGYNDKIYKDQIDVFVRKYEKHLNKVDLYA